ncbi:hypothetical protein HDU76_012229 [Blyttiomyces sp. JEL0837]|nr:hypothetical protein HDU76_012229 [Blyttiomyces sp. JEL0837]
MKIERVTKIVAPASRVHSILLDVAKYPDWCPMLKAVTGTPQPWTIVKGGPMVLWIPLAYGWNTPAPVTVKECTPLTPSTSRYEITWEGKLIFESAFHATHSFISEQDPENENHTIFTQFELFEGVLPLPLDYVGGFIPGSAAAAKRYDDFNEALKKRAEEWKE